MIAQTKSKHEGSAIIMLGNHARLLAVPPKQQHGVYAKSTEQTVRVLKRAAATPLLGKGFARSMVQKDSALLKDVMMVYTLMVSAASTVPNQSALGNDAPRPCNQREGVSSTVVAGQKCAR